nr:MAG TPA: hypothetical protein [Caudoviricetes sp.]
MVRKHIKATDTIDNKVFRRLQEICEQLTASRMIKLTTIACH